MRQPVKQTGYI